ncbi:MAG: O-antigen ligase family protein [Desulfobacteraceae bacterium]|nr:O-antigen ligase family protein [Desulfobacteraceae bacterium]
MTGALSKKLFFFVIIFSPLAFGTVEPWSYAVMEISVVAGFFLYFIHIYKTNVLLYKVPGIIPLCLFLLYILIQIIPLPPQVIKIISPASYEIQEAALQMTISIHPRSTLLEFFRYSTYVVFYVFAVQLLSDKDLLKKSIFVITIFGSVLAFSSILQLYLTDEMALWFRHSPGNDAIMGPYINRNHYAGLMEMIFPVALALFLFHRPRTENTTFFSGIIEIFKQEKANIHILIGTGALLIITSIFISLSRGGMISTCIGLIFFLGLSFKKKASKQNSILIISLIIIAGFSISWFGWHPINDRFSSLQTSAGDLSLGRYNYWEDSKGIINNFPVTGSGFGTFSDIYPSFQTIDGRHDLQHAHNDYVELMTEGGIIGVLLIFSFLATLFFKTYKAFRLRKDAWSIYIYMGSITGMISILIHSFSDFNMHIGANGLWFAFMAALAVSASNTRLKVKNIATNLLPVRLIRTKHTAFATTISIFLIIIMCNVSILIASFYYSNIQNSNMEFNTSPEELEKIKKITSYASLFDPLNSKYVHATANLSWFLGENKEAKELYLKSIRLDPANGNHVKRFGLFLSQTNEVLKAEKVLRNSITLDISSADNTFQYGGLLLAMGQKKKGIKYLKKAISLDKDLINSVLTTMIASGLSLEEMEQAIPKDPGTAIVYTDFLNQIGETEKAEKRYFDILTSLTTHDNISRKHIYKIYRFFMAQGNLFQATEVLKQGEVLLPSDSSIRVRLGDLYKKQGILFKAKEKYEEALLLDPKNRGAKARLDRLNQ